MQSQRTSYFLRLLLSFVLLLSAVFVFLNRQHLLDQFTVWRFSPTSSIQAIADRAAFSDPGEFLFLATQPELLERDAFNTACRSTATERTAILGCYSANRIFLFNINDERLDGIKEVTAAHEMLHAAYQRLSKDEKTRVDNLLRAQDLGEDTDRINELMAEYAETEPGEHYNELHSIIGSEVSKLNPELEAYYNQYFDNRTAVVALSNSYQGVFDEIQARQDSLVGELNVLADQVDRETSAYRRNLQVLENDIEAFNADASSGTLSRQEFDSRRQNLEIRQASLRREYNSIQVQIERYEEKRAELEAINSESTALNRTINSSLNPVPEGLDG